MTTIVSEKAVAKIGNRFDLILVASRRVRELVNGYRPFVNIKGDYATIALTEIEEGYVGREYLLKPTEIDSDRRIKNKHRNYR